MDFFNNVINEWLICHKQRILTYKDLKSFEPQYEDGITHQNSDTARISVYKEAEIVWDSWGRVLIFSIKFQYSLRNLM